MAVGQAAFRTAAMEAELSSKHGDKRRSGVSAEGGWTHPDLLRACREPASAPSGDSDAGGPLGSRGVKGHLGHGAIPIPAVATKAWSL